MFDATYDMLVLALFLFGFGIDMTLMGEKPHCNQWNSFKHLWRLRIWSFFMLLISVHCFMIDGYYVVGTLTALFFLGHAHDAYLTGYVYKKTLYELSKVDTNEDQ